MPGLCCTAPAVKILLVFVFFKMERFFFALKNRARLLTKLLEMYPTTTGLRSQAKARKAVVESIFVASAKASRLVSFLV